MEDASLDEFLDSGEGDADDDADGAGGDTDDGTGDTEDDAGAVEGEASATEGEGDPAPDDVAPATSTYQWAPDGAACASCGGTARRRWRSDAGLVCGECKEW